MQIKAIRNRLDNAEAFDEEVNNALKDGWLLMKREVINPQAQSNTTTTHIMLYAEFIK